MMGLSGIALLTAGVFILLGAEAQVLRKGNCPPKPVIKNFSWKGYLGKWYEQERYFTLFAEAVGRCWVENYFVNPDNGGISAILRFNDRILKDRQEVEIDLIAKDPYRAPAKLTFSISGVPVFEDNYEIIATDYVTYTIHYNCMNIPLLGHAEFAYILTRSPHPSYDVISRAKAEMERFGIDTRPLQRVSEGCIF